jgi:hypothetical protein
MNFIPPEVNIEEGRHWRFLAGEKEETLANRHQVCIAGERLGSLPEILLLNQLSVGSEALHQLNGCTNRRRLNRFGDHHPRAGIDDHRGIGVLLLNYHCLGRARAPVAAASADHNPKHEDANNGSYNNANRNPSCGSETDAATVVPSPGRGAVSGSSTRSQTACGTIPSATQQLRAVLTVEGRVAGATEVVPAGTRVGGVGRSTAAAQIATSSIPPTSALCDAGRARGPGRSATICCCPRGEHCADNQDPSRADHGAVTDWVTRGATVVG